MMEQRQGIFDCRLKSKEKNLKSEIAPPKIGHNVRLS
jgi:hypothetical protein